MNEDLAFRSQAGVQLNIPAGFEVLSPNDGRIDLIARAQDGVVILLVPQESTLTARELALEIFHAAKNPTRRLVSESDETRNGREAFRLRSEMEENGDLFECSTIIMKGTTRHNILIISALATNPPEVKTIFEDIANSFLASQP